MSQSSLGNLWQKLDDWRVSQHFKRVEVTLRAQDMSHLSPTLQQARKHYLNCLHEYAVRGIFPRNYERPGYSPCFIDCDGRECAVAHLVMASGHATLAHKISEVANYAYVPQLTFPELDDWANQSGLSREELALIQPGYYFTLTGPYLWTAIAAWTIGLLTVLMNRVEIARKRKAIATPVLSLIVAIVLLFVAYFCLDGATAAYDLGTHPDGFPYDLPLHDVPLLTIGVLMSVGLALWTGGLGLYRIRDFISAKRQIQ